MSVEFTGERVIPGQVDDDLWNEHFARYLFVRGLAAGRRVLDAGCGAGYGASELSAVARSVTAIDIAGEALQYAGAHYDRPAYVQASATRLPFAAGSFDLVVMYEVIEHLADWRNALFEARRTLTPEGVLVVSTPNKSFYADTRRDTGPNPYHEHEFEYAEFRQALEAVFPHVTMFVEDHTGGVVFRPAAGSGPAEVRIAETGDLPEHGSFFIGLCSQSPIEAPPTFVYVPRATNLLREKILHIERLEDEVLTKDRWIAQQQTAHQELLIKHAEVHADLEKSNLWAAEVGREIEQARGRIGQLEDELRRLNERAQAMVEGYERKSAQLHEDLRLKAAWALDLERRLTADLDACIADRDNQTAELGKAVELLHQTEAALEERTRWAKELDQTVERLEAAVAAARSSRWVRLGRTLGVGPELREH